MKEYFNFNGKAKRQEFWAVHVIAIFVIAFGIVFMEQFDVIGALIGIGLFIATLWAIIAVTVKRLRDADLHPLWILTIFIPYMGFISTIVFGCIGSKEKENG